MKIKRKKIISRVSETDYLRLESITHSYGFKSVYALLNYIALCFLRAVDRVNDPYADLPADEIIRMFPIKEDTREVNKVIGTLRARRNRRLRKSIKAKNLRNKHRDEIGEEVKKMFNECEESGRGSEFPDNLRKRNER